MWTPRSHWTCSDKRSLAGGDGTEMTEAQSAISARPLRGHRTLRPASAYQALSNRLFTAQLDEVDH
jgi:hypothetical protein